MTLRVDRAILTLLILLLAAAGSLPAFAVNPPPTQVFYVPFPEDQQLAAFKAVNSAAVEPIGVFITLSAATDGTVIYYDHWEDGYETDITNPSQSTTLIFGDGNPANGYPPGNPGDLIPAGTVFNLRNFVTTTSLQSVVDYDARDKIASFKPISVTKMTFPGGTNTLLAGCVEVFERGLWGTEYRSPVGVNMPTSTAASPLTFDENLFNYTSLAISAGAGGASVQIDKDNDGTFEETVALAEGETVYRDTVNVGGHVLADKPVQVILFTGTTGSNYASRDSSLLPVYRWSSDYYAPVSTRTTPMDGTVVFLYNPGLAAITVNYDFRSSASAYTTASVSVPAKGNARVTLTPSDGSTNFGAYRFYTTGASPPVFYAVGAIDADDTSGNNQNWDGGFTLVGKPSLTTQALVSLGIGRDPYSTTNPTENGNPVWITTAGNGHTVETVYVDYNGDNSGALTDPNGNHYDVAYSLRELVQQKILDPDGDQSGMLIYTLNPNVKIAAVWAQDPSVASVAQPGLDVASLVPPLREGSAGKRSTLYTDADGDGVVSAGDTLEYDIRTVSDARTVIPGPFKVTDTIPVDTTYVPGSTRYRYTTGGIWQAWVNLPDDGSGTPFPLDSAGYSVPGNLSPGQQLQVTFRAVIDNYVDLSGSSIVNTGSVEISPYGLNIPIDWTDSLYGSIGDRVWNDLDGDGVQDAGESGINGIIVYADSNNSGSRDIGEPTATTAGDGAYVLTGLLAGSYTVRVDAASVAAVNVGYGASYDLDTLVTTNSAVVTLLAAQDRTDADFGYRVGASIGNRVWQDRDNNGVQAASEPGINGVRVYIDSNNNNLYDPGEPNTITSGDGVYYIGNLNPGTYNVRVDITTLPVGLTQTFDLNGGLDHEAAVTLIAAEHRGDLDFGYRGSLSLGDLVWQDDDANGAQLLYNIIDGRIDINASGGVGSSDDGYIGTTQIINGFVDVSNDGAIGGADDGSFRGYTVIDGGLDVNASGTITTGDDSTGGIVGELGIANVRVFIDANGNGTFDVTEANAITSASGAYSIGNLSNGTYTVRVDTTTLPFSYSETYDLTAPTTDHSATVAISGSSRTDVDFGYRNDASLGDLVWNDRNANGVRDAGEPGIANVLVYIDADGDNLYDQGIELIAITDVNGAYSIGNLPAGTYGVRIEISTLPPGAVQTFDLDGTLDNETSRTLAKSEDAVNVDFGYRTTASVGDFVWNDLDADGVQDGGEAGLSGVRVYLDTNGDDVFNSATEPSAVTNGSGAYTIGSLLPGTYTARIDTSTLPAGYVQTYDLSGGLDHAATFSLSANQVRTDIDFGYVSPASVGDLVWNDLDGDGQKDAGESGINGVTVTLYRSDDALIATTTTAGGGLYGFPTLLPGSYYIDFGTLAGYTRTSVDQGADASDSDANATTGRTASFTLAAGQTNTTLDAGLYQPATISGTVFADSNNDNIGDTGIVGVSMTLYTDPNGDGNRVDGVVVGSPVLTTTGGVYSFTGLAPGSYVVVETQPAGYLTVTDGDSTTPGDDAANSSTTDNAIPVTVTGGETDGGNDFVEEQPGTISGTVLVDNNNDDAGDVGLAGVTLILYTDPNGDGNRSDGVAVGSPYVTVSGGAYNFTNLAPGSYVVEETQPGGYLTVTDGDTTSPGDDTANASSIDNSIPVAIAASETDNGNNFVEELPGSLTGAVLQDIDNNGSGDLPMAAVLLTLVDAAGNPIDGNPSLPGVQLVTTATALNGSYSFTGLAPGTYGVLETQPSGFASVSDKDGGDLNQIRPIAVPTGGTNTGNDFVEIQFGAISGLVYADADGDGLGDTPMQGVILRLLNGAGDPVLDGSNQPITTTTAADGTYSFNNLVPGAYQVFEEQPIGYGSLADSDGSNLDWIGNDIPLVVPPGVTVTNRNFAEAQLGAISGHVYVGSNPLAGVTLALLDAAGQPVLDGSGHPITTVTAVDGSYSFNGVMPGAYKVAQVQPEGYDDFGDADGGDLNIIGDVTAIVVLPGQTNANNNFVETLDTCPDTWAQWKFQHPGEEAPGNPDADRHDNFAEFAFAQNPNSGAGDAWYIAPSTTSPGTIEGVFTRPKGAYLNVVYTLEFAASLGNPVVWQSVEIIPAMITVVPNADCTETVTIHDLETLTGLQDGKGVVRIHADLDEENDDVIDHTSHTETEGWKETGLALCCRTYCNPFLRSTVFTGVVSGVIGQTIDLSASSGLVDIQSLLTSGAYYVEVTAGDLNGHRFDVLSASGGTLTLANDSNLFANAAPFNTLTGAIPAGLAGDSIVIRRHWTLAEQFPPAALGASDNRNTSDEVQIFADGQWIVYWLYTDGVAAPKWVKMGDNTYADQGASILAPGQGMFFNNRTAVNAILAYGEVRQNDFIRPLAVGNNLVSGGYPLDQSPAGRNMTVPAGFFGSRDTATADSIFVWNGDATVGASGYATYFLNSNAPRVPLVIKWAKVGDATLASRDAELLLLGDRSVLERSKNGLAGYKSACPWVPGNN